MNMKCVSSTAGPIPRTVSKSALTLLFIMGLGEMLSFQRSGSIKKGNRKSEILLRDAEVGAASNFELVCPLSLTCPQHVATLASIFKSNEYKYPKPSLDNSWEKVLLNQCM